MATVYIDPVSGNDSRTYAQAQNLATPWATISKGVGYSSTGDTIVLLDGTYTIGISPNVAVASRTIRAANRGQAIITAAFNNSTLPTFGYWFSVGNTYTLTFSGVKFLNCTGDNAVSLFSGVYGGQIIVENCIFENFDASAGGSTCYLARSTNVIFRNNLVNGFKVGANSAIFHCTGSGTLSIQNSSFYTAALAANCFWLNASGGTVTILNTIVQNAASPQSLSFVTGAGTVSIGADSWLRNIASAPGGVNTSDPLFIDPANKIFRLRPTSPCLNAGVNP